MRKKLQKGKIQLLLNTDSRLNQNYAMDYARTLVRWKSYKKIPAYIKLLALHSLITIFTLIIAPPPPITPKIFIPLTIAASYCTAITLYWGFMIFGRRRTIKVILSLKYGRK